MAAIPWREFTKEELVEILSELGQAGGYEVEPLWSESNVYYRTDCTCSPNEVALPARVIELRDRAVRRMQAPPKPSFQPLRNLLRRPFRRHA